jgi:hypothetical protein
MTTNVKKKKDYQLTEEQQKLKDEIDEQIDGINEQLKKKDYILTVHQEGDKSMSRGDRERQVDTRRWYVVCSLEEIPEYINRMKIPFWRPEERGLSEKERKDYPFEKKKWGKYWNVTIEPFSEELEKDYLSGIKDGFFETWREVHKREEMMEVPKERRSI